MHSRFVNLCVATLVVGLLSVSPSSCFAATFAGSEADGVSDIVYDAMTNMWSILPDGDAVGLYDLRSESGIFTGAPVMQPPGGFGNNDMEGRKSSAGFTALNDEFDLGALTPDGFDPTSVNLLQDLTIVFSGGLGTPNRDGGFICLNCGVTNTPPVGMDDIAVGFKGTTFDYQFVATDAEDDPSALTWSNLVFNSGPGGATPANAPTLGADGAFSWAIAAGPTNDPQGEWSWTATVTDTGGLSGSATLRVDVTIPEPATALLMGLAVAGLAFIRRR